MKKEYSLFSLEDISPILTEVSSVMWNNKSLRYGQTLWNVASERNKPLMDSLVGTDKDFFYITDNKKAFDLFVKSCVKPSEEI